MPDGIINIPVIGNARVEHIPTEEQDQATMAQFIRAREAMINPPIVAEQLVVQREEINIGDLQGDRRDARRQWIPNEPFNRLAEGFLPEGLLKGAPEEPEVPKPTVEMIMQCFNCGFTWTSSKGHQCLECESTDTTVNEVLTLK